MSGVEEDVEDATEGGDALDRAAGEEEEEEGEEVALAKREPLSLSLKVSCMV